LARFQKPNLLSGAVGSMLLTMLAPIVVCYYAILAGVELAIAPVDPEWYVLLGNFDPDIHPHGITPYWFVCLYVQALLLVALPFALPAVRDWVRARPLAAGLTFMAGCVGVAAALGLPEQLGPLGLRHPLLALQLIALGWAGFHARGAAEMALVTAAALVVGFTFAPAGPSAPVLIAGAMAAMLWIGTVALPRPLARATMYIGKQSMFLYLAHVVVIALLAKLGVAPDALMLVLAIGVSLIAAEGMARAMRHLRFPPLASRAGVQEIEGA
jgi:hypothetical protein